MYIGFWFIKKDNLFPILGLEGIQVYNYKRVTVLNERLVYICDSF